MCTVWIPSTAGLRNSISPESQSPQLQAFVHMSPHADPCFTSWYRPSLGPTLTPVSLTPRDPQTLWSHQLLARAPRYPSAASFSNPWLGWAGLQKPPSTLGSEASSPSCQAQSNLVPTHSLGQLHWLQGLDCEHWALTTYSTSGADIWCHCGLPGHCHPGPVFFSGLMGMVLDGSMAPVIGLGRPP